MKILDEMRRRRLIQTAALYVAVAWGGTEILVFLTESLFSETAARDARRYLAILLIAGFPAAMYLAWSKDLGRKARRFVSAGAVAVLASGVIVYLIPPPKPEAAMAMIENSIAVLPFEVCEDRPSDRQLAGGLTVEVYNRLAQRDRLLVKGRKSLEAVIESKLSADAIAELLGVEYLLNGVLCRDGIDLTLRAELTDNKGFVVWTTDLTEVVNPSGQVEQQLAMQIENAVAGELGDAVASSPGRAVDRHALEYLLIGREHRRRGERDEARAALEKALDAQPDYAEAMWELALIEFREASLMNQADAYERAKPILEEALESAVLASRRDPRNFDANRVAGGISYFLGFIENELAFRESPGIDDEEVATWQIRSRDYFAAAERYYRAALAGNPSDSDIRDSLVRCLDRQSAEKRKESLEILERGLETDPFNSGLNANIASRLVEFGRLPEAMERLDRFRVLPQGKRDVWFRQFEILQNYGAWDKKLAYQIEAAKAHPNPGPEAAGSVWFAMMHFTTTVSDMAWLGLFEEAEELHALTTQVLDSLETSDQREWWRQLFHDGSYLKATGRGDEFARKWVERVAGKSNEEILKAWQVESDNLAGAFWAVGERERAIELLEALQHWRIEQTRWAERQWRSAMTLAYWYMQVGREEDADPILEEIVSHLQSEVDAGVRHPETLMRLANAYGMQGNVDKAMELTDLGIDYGAFWTPLCCPDYVPELAQEFAEYKGWLAELEDDPRFIHATSRMRAIVDMQRSNIRALLAQNDMEALLESWMMPKAQSE